MDNISSQRGLVEATSPLFCFNIRQQSQNGLRISRLNPSFMPNHCLVIAFVESGRPVASLTDAVKASAWLSPPIPVFVTGLKRGAEEDPTSGRVEGGSPIRQLALGNTKYQYVRGNTLEAYMPYFPQTSEELVEMIHEKGTKINFDQAARLLAVYNAAPRPRW